LGGPIEIPIPADEITHRLQLLRKNDEGKDVYLDLDIGGEIYISPNVRGRGRPLRS
jgi:hypothetical protein